jgi:hypothetical protein
MISAQEPAGLLIAQIMVMCTRIITGTRMGTVMITPMTIHMNMGIVIIPIPMHNIPMVLNQCANL